MRTFRLFQTKRQPINTTTTAVLLPTPLDIPNYCYHEVFAFDQQSRSKSHPLSNPSREANTNHEPLVLRSHQDQRVCPASCPNFIDSHAVVAANLRTEQPPTILMHPFAEFTRITPAYPPVTTTLTGPRPPPSASLCPLTRLQLPLPPPSLPPLPPLRQQLAATMIGALPLPDPLLLLRAQANFAAASPRASPPILLPPPFPPTAWTQLAAFSGDALGRPDGRPGRRVPRVYPNGALGADMTGWPSGFRAAGETP